MLKGTGARRIEALRLAEIYRANVVDATLSRFVLEVTGTALPSGEPRESINPRGSTWWPCATGKCPCRR